MSRRDPRPIVRRGGGSVLAVGIPAFVRDIHASRLVKLIDGLNRIAASVQASDNSAPQAYPDDAPQTPRVVPSGTPVQDPPGTWDHPTWARLGRDARAEQRRALGFDVEIVFREATHPRPLHGLFGP